MLKRRRIEKALYALASSHRLFSEKAEYLVVIVEMFLIKA